MREQTQIEHSRQTKDRVPHECPAVRIDHWAWHWLSWIPSFAARVARCVQKILRRSLIDARGRTRARGKNAAARLGSSRQIQPNFACVLSVKTQTSDHNGFDYSQSKAWVEAHGLAQESRHKATLTTGSRTFPTSNEERQQSHSSSPRISIFRLIKLSFVRVRKPSLPSSSSVCSQNGAFWKST